MKNSLMTVICILIVLLIVLLMVKGLSIGNLKILSISQILQSGEQLATWKQQLKPFRVVNNST